MNASDPYSLGIIQETKNSLKLKNLDIKQPSSIWHSALCRTIGVW